MEFVCGSRRPTAVKMMKCCFLNHLSVRLECAHIWHSALPVCCSSARAACTAKPKLYQGHLHNMVCSAQRSFSDGQVIRDKCVEEGECKCTKAQLLPM